MLFHFYLLCLCNASISCVICCVYLLFPFVVLILCVLLGRLLFRMPPKKPSKGAAQQQAAASLKFAADATSSEIQRATAIEIIRLAAVAATAREKMPAAEEQPPSSPPTSPAKSVATSPATSQGQSPGRQTKNSNKPTSGGSTDEDGGSTDKTTPEASKKRKIDKSSADNVGSSSSQTGRVRKQVDRLGNFAAQDHTGDEEEKHEEEDDGEDEDDDEEDEIRSQPLTPSRSLELPILKHLKKGRQIKSVSPLGDPHPHPNFP